MMPPVTVDDNYADFSDVAACMPSLGLTYVYRAFEIAGAKPVFRDFQQKSISKEEIIAVIEQGSYDAVGMQTFITNINRCLAIASLIKERLPHVKVLLGGAHATIFSDEVMQDPSVDFLFLGESEQTIKEFVPAFQKGDREALRSMKGIYYRDEDGAVYKNDRRPLIENLDEVPFPKYDMFDVRKYYPAVHIRGSRVFNMMTSRGCPYSCSFCAATKVFGSGFRFHSIERTIEEMRYLKNNMHADSLQIYDDNFTTHKRRVKELCEAMIREKLNLKWNCYTRADHMGDEEMLRLMKRAGCYMMVCGIENGNERILKLLNKRLNLTKARENLEKVRKAGINVQASFMIGLPGETREEIQNTIDFADSLPITYATFPVFTPYPGTPIYADAEALGTILSQNYDEYSRWGEGVYTSNGIPPEEYKAFQKKAFNTFYLKPSRLLKCGWDALHFPFPRFIRYAMGGLRYFANR